MVAGYQRAVSDYLVLLVVGKGSLPEGKGVRKQNINHLPARNGGEKPTGLIPHPDEVVTVVRNEDKPWDKLEMGTDMRS